MGDNQDTWPGGQTWVFQCTVAEDATGGTHVCSLTVTPGAGNEMQVLGGFILVGNTATAQQSQVFITDGTNNLRWILNPDGATTTTANLTFPFPRTTAGLTANNPETGSASSLIVSGTMALKLSVTTAAISVTQTFAVVCRLKTGQIPTAVLADSVGTPTLTINTNKVF